MAKRRIKRKITHWQVKDQGSDPLTKRGRKYIQKEIKKLNRDKLRKQLENQVFEEKDVPSPYWKYLDSHGYEQESIRANPDTYGDDLNNTVDGDYESY